MIGPSLPAAVRTGVRTGVRDPCGSQPIRCIPAPLDKPDQRTGDLPDDRFVVQ
jgi:hypothetical protein